MRIAQRFCLLLGLGVLSAVPAAAQDVEGVWVFSVNSPDGLVQMEVEFEHDGVGTDAACHVDAVFVAQQVLQQDFQAERQPGNIMLSRKFFEAEVAVVLAVDRQAGGG